MANSLGSVDVVVSVVIIQLSLSSKTAAIDNMYTNERVCVPVTF